MKHLCLLAILLIVNTGVFCQDIIIGFGNDQGSISNHYNSLLTQRLKDFQICDSVFIIGHTDTVGTAGYNAALSRMRAESVKQWLAGKNIDPDIIRTYWKGESEILDSESDEINRRVEVFIFKNQFNFNGTENQIFNKQARFFKIDNSRDTTILGLEGTYIELPANSINPAKVSDNKIFEVSLTEYYTLSDIVLNRLTTRTTNEILETKGMINLTIVQDGMECTISRIKPIKVGFPNTDQSEDKMRLFYGKPDEDCEIIWEEAQNPEDYSIPVFVLVEEMPEFPGKDIARISFLSRNIIYPQQATEKGIEGTVYISFIVDSAGNIFNAKILRGIGGGCDEEALRVLNLMPRWIPGRQNGKNVAVLFTMPIIFSLDGNGQAGVNQSGIAKGEYLSMNDSAFQKANIQNINRYIFDVLSLGWINCDQIVYKNRPQINLSVKLKTSGHISAYIIFTKTKSVLSGVNKNGYCMFNQVPKGEEIILIAIRKVQGKCYFGQKNIKVSSSIESLDNFEEISFDNLNNRIDGIRKGFYSVIQLI